MYTVTLGPDQKQTFGDRKEAILAARALSKERRSPVKVVRDDGNEQMVYQRGQLTEATFVTLDQRGRKARA
ncbi:MAG: hypothetical protein D6798_11885 [Deltaproteobacteria bacterium]|nr:MAG: hypothetical protein D6798_11885 [Deltaproteobacteria bacterium]